MFDGRIFARKKEEQLSSRVARLKRKRITPKLVSIIVGDNPASSLYISLKKKAAERIGAELEVISLNSGISPKKVVQSIEQQNNSLGVHGVMVQLPLPKMISNSKFQILNSIAPGKDIDGLRRNSPFIPATVKAILQLIKVAKEKLGHDFENVVVVGASGMVGKPLVGMLRKLQYNVIECDVATKNLKEIANKADLLVSATGIPGLIKGDMVKEGIAIIDVGSPRADIDASVYSKAGFLTPVPGGVGPVTIVSLLDNLLIAAENLVK